MPLRWLIVWLIFSHAPRATHPGDAGQSNMVFPLHLAFNVTQEVASLAESPTQFRFFQTARDYSDTPQFDLKPEPACESTPITTHRVIVLAGTGGLNGISVPPRRHPAVAFADACSIMTSPLFQTQCNAANRTACAMGCENTDGLCNQWVDNAQALANNASYLKSFSAVCFMTVRF